MGSSGFRAEEVMGIFWPRAAYAKMFNHEPHPDMLKEVNCASGPKNGVIMEDDVKPFPSGCARMYNYGGVGVQKAH